jgi:hypothetical protein
MRQSVVLLRRKSGGGHTKADPPAGGSALRREEDASFRHSPSSCSSLIHRGVICPPPLFLLPPYGGLRLAAPWTPCLYRVAFYTNPAAATRDGGQGRPCPSGESPLPSPPLVAHPGCVAQPFSAVPHGKGETELGGVRFGRALKEAGMGRPLCALSMGRGPKATGREQGDSRACVIAATRIPELYNSGILVAGETQTRRCSSRLSETDRAQPNWQRATPAPHATPSGRRRPSGGVAGPQGASERHPCEGQRAACRDDPPTFPAPSANASPSAARLALLGASARFPIGEGAGPYGR